MVPMPPPPDLTNRSAGGPQPLPGTEAPFSSEPIHARPGQLTTVWRWVLLLGWLAVIVGLMAVGGAGDVIGKVPWWLDGALVVIPFVLPVLTVLAAIGNWRSAVWLGLASVVSVAVTALIDIDDSPGVAAATGVLALIGLLTTVSSFAGRVPRIDAG